MVVVAALILAGCVTPAPDEAADEATDIPSELPWSFTEPTVIGEFTNNQIEAFIAASEDGQTLLSCAHGLFQRPAWMYASTDGGDTWTTLEPTVDMGVSGDCEVAITADGSTWAFVHTGIATLTVSTTQDQGASWTVTRAPGGAAWTDRPWLAYHGERLWLSWIPTYYGPMGVGVTFSDDHGSTWSDAVAIAEVSADEPSFRAGQFIFGPGQTVSVPVVAQRGGLAGTPYLASSDDGQVWTLEALDAIKMGYHNPVGVQRSGDVLYWVHPHADTDGLMWMARRDGGDWTEPRLLSDSLGWPRPWASGAPGEALDVYWENGTTGGRSGGSGNHLAVARIHVDHDGPLQGPTALFPAATTEFAELTHDGSGRIHAVVASRPATGDVGRVQYVRQL